MELICFPEVEGESVVIGTLCCSQLALLQFGRRALPTSLITEVKQNKRNSIFIRSLRKQCSPKLLRTFANFDLCHITKCSSTVSTNHLHGTRRGTKLPSNCHSQRISTVDRFRLGGRRRCSGGVGVNRNPERGATRPSSAVVSAGRWRRPKSYFSSLFRSTACNKVDSVKSCLGLT